MSDTHTSDNDSRLYFTPRGQVRALRLALARMDTSLDGPDGEQAYLRVLDEIMKNPGPVCEHLALMEVIAALSIYMVNFDRALIEAKLAQALDRIAANQLDLFGDEPDR
jgi:hypothetical protein